MTLLIERFKEFAKETESIGTERVAAVNEIADSLISVGHTDAATIAQWKVIYLFYSAIHTCIYLPIYRCR